MNSTLVAMTITTGLLMISCTKKPDPIIEPPGLLEHSIVRYDYFDKPSKTQVEIKILIKESSNISKEKLEELLSYLYNVEMAKSSFKYHNPPNAVYMYAYLTMQKANMGPGAVATMIKSYSDINPTFDFNEMEFAVPKENKGDRWGLPYNTRMKIWGELIWAERRAENMAEEKYPLDKRITQQEMIKRGKLNNTLTKEFELEISQRYSIMMAIIDSISLEGLTHSWSFPD